jgi:hypothetical protein
MTFWLRPFRVVAAVALVLSLICQGTLVLAGTTGTLSGNVIDSSSHQPLVGAKVTATSPSQSATVSTDRSGHFIFLALAPDTYTISIALAGYDASSQSGETVIADGTRTVSISASKSLQTIGKVTSRAATELVKPGTTADVYSVNATQQEKSAAFGGGGNLNTAFSALASVPGVFVAPGQAGYIGAGPGLSIRGGDYDQIGYEIDGVPVNRAFDSYPSGPASSLGQQELQVYTGAAPASAEAQGLSGYINQVIKTGTNPASTTLTGDIGGPAYYHKFSIETSGATTDRNFSYYVGLGGYNQDFRYVDQFNGQGVSNLYGIPLEPCSDTFSPALAPSCYNNGVYNGNTGALEAGYAGGSPGHGSFVLGGANLYSQSTVADRDSVVNFHFGLPHKNGTKDDIQLLYVNNYINTTYYDSPNDLGGYGMLGALGLGDTYATGLQYKGATGVALPTNYQANVVPYGFPQAGQNAYGGLIPATLRDGVANNQGIFKFQYTHAIGETALLKLYGYTYYSDWLYQSPTSYNTYYYGNPVDYELHSHTRGVSAQFTDQIGSNDVLTIQGSDTIATTLRDNNSFYAIGPSTTLAALVSSANPLNGLCYTSKGVATTCASGGGAAFATFGQAQTGTVPAIAPGTTCSGAACEYYVVANGLSATYNTVEPKFFSAVLTDTYKPTNKISLDAGIRLDRFEYDGSDTDTGNARTFWYNSYNLDNCVAAGGASIIPRAPGAACPAGSTPANFTNPSGTVIEAYDEFQPRTGVTYTLDPSTVVRASYGRFAQAPNSAYQQYDTLQADSPATLYGVYGFQKYGFTTPDHTVVPPTSDNLDFSVEHQFGSDTSIKLSPFLRTTQNQIQNFYLNQQTGFVSGLNVGHQTSEGLEFELDKGNFARDGLAAKLSLAYTNSYIQYGPLSNGSSIIDPLNTQIKNYNAYTSFCASHAASAQCAGGQTVSGAAAAPCYTTAGAAVAVGACTAADVANPYWNAPVQALLDPNADYRTFDTFPAGVGSSVDTYGAPYTATLLVQYKKKRLAVTPALQFFGGQRYGATATTLGIAPDTCTAAGTAIGGGRYPYGSAGGSGYNYANCTGILGAADTPNGSATGGIPDVYTGKFDSLGAFVEPSQFQLHMQITYDISPRVSLVVNLANIYKSCFGGSKTGFTVAGACTYGLVAGGATGAVGNTYNPGSAIQPYVSTPYEPDFNSSNPFGIFVSARAKI